MLIKRSERQARWGKIASELARQSGDNLDRRSFLRRSGLAAGSLAALGSLPLGSIRQAEAGPPPPASATVTVRKNFCTHCSVGCSVIAEVANGVWIGQEPDYDSPINRGSHCCKGAAVRDDVLSDRRLRYPQKLVDGQWKRLSWDQAINEIGDKLLDIRQKAGPDSVYWLPQPQARRLLGHEQFRPPGAHLSLHYGHRGRQYLGLRCDDQQLQRHP